eukprot:CAMPEP_0185028544 /NCGR_PEP_ID=MMETSP1103-20130426/14315_1 /TAXON_ID=36769 /ORGANISM="Paraphysomonas bandaiensis, Strain Caron Lab Isolate" /LENGTH=319 /DNA_ID=CAMNT_0027562989 /DNA_START=23 /DNA_END=982 /DNA_ORIENTATION=-
MANAYDYDGYCYYMPSYDNHIQDVHANDTGGSRWQSLHPQRGACLSPSPRPQIDNNAPVFRMDTIGCMNTADGCRNGPLNVRPMLLYPSNKIILIPENENMSASLLRILNDENLSSDPLNLHSTPKMTLWLNICPSDRMSAMTSVMQSPEDASIIVPIVPTPLASVRLPPKLTHPKYITQSHALSSYRVQVNTGKKSAKNEKFSRNVGNIEDAMWLCECALIMSGNVSSLRNLVEKGNYKCFVQRRMIGSLSDFPAKLRYNAIAFKECGILRQAECECVLNFLESHTFYGMEHTVGRVTGNKRERGETDDVSSLMSRDL